MPYQSLQHHGRAEGKRLPPLRHLPEALGRVALTFDDGPHPEFTPVFLDRLVAAGAKATFFVIAAIALDYPELIRRMVQEGHTVASHGWSHRHPWWQSPASARRQVEQANEALASLLGSPPRWFRPPYGRMRPAMHQAASEAGQRVVLWSRSAVDWGPLARPTGILQRLSSVQAGDIILMHDAPNQHNRPDVSVEILPSLLTQLDAKGLRSVAL